MAVADSSGVLDREGNARLEILHLMIDSLDIGVVVLDTRQQVMCWNLWMAQVSGIARKQAVGKELVELFPELAGGRTLGAIHDALSRGFPSLLSQSLNKAPFPIFRRVTPTGSHQRVQQRIRVLPLRHGGEVSHCLVEIQDVSLTVYREKIIREQKKFLDTILDSEPEWVFVLDPSGAPIQMNRAGLDLLGVPSLAEVKERGLPSFISPDHRSAFDRLCQQVLAGAPGALDFQIQGPNGGGNRWLDVHAAPLVGSHGAAVAILGVARDITARREAEATTRSLIDANQESAVLLDQAGQILAINAIGARQLKQPAGGLIGQNYHGLLAAPVAACHRDKAEEVFRHGRPVKFQEVLDGRHFDVNLYPVSDADGKVRAVSVYSADVTDQLQLVEIERLFHSIDDQILARRQQPSLLAYICGQVAAIFDYPAVWIGRRMRGGELAITASGGSAGAYVDALLAIGERWDDSLLGRGPAGTAVRTGQAQTCASEDIHFGPWRGQAHLFGLRTQLSLPLILRGEIYGAFNLASRLESDFQGPARVQVLMEIAARICVAIERAFDQERLMLLETALSSAANGVFITDQMGRIQWVNGAFEKMTGCSREESVGSISRLLQPHMDESGFFQQVRLGMAEGKAWSGDRAAKRKDGTSVVFRQTITPICDASNTTTHFISILEDVTAAREAEAHVRRLAHYDYLTGLPNRSLFQDRLQHELVRAKRDAHRLALMFLDLDGFKAVNDQFGHEVGDYLLKAVAERLTGCIRESDTVARLAGDEFTLLLPDVRFRDDIDYIARKIIAAISKPFHHGKIQVEVGVSIGVAIFPEHAQDPVELLKNADSAMYAAKAGGRNGYKIFPANKVK